MDLDLPIPEKVDDKVLTHARKWDLHSVQFLSGETLTAAGIDITTELPDGVSAILLTACYRLPEKADRMPARFSFA